MSAASTPVKLKMVTFKLPQDSPKPSAATPTEKATSLSSSQDAKLDAKLSSPVVNDPQVTKKDSFPSKIRETPKKHVIQVPSTSSQQSALQKPAPQTHTPQANPLRSPEPDLVADILNRPKSVHPKLLESMQLDRADSKPTSQQQQQQVEQKGSAINSRSKKAGFISSTRERPSVASKRKKEHLNPAKTAADIREQTNAASHNHTRSLKYDVGKLRESLLKVEEEIKHLNRGRHTLEMGIHDIRKALSVNQQSISNQQKKSRGTEDPCLKLLREEAKVLSRSKRKVEQHLQTVRSRLQELDHIRRTLKPKIASYARSLELDAQNFKLYGGPVAVRSDAVSRQRQYVSACPAPKHRTEDTGAAQLCSKALESLACSRAVRAEIRSLLVSVQTRKQETHVKITTAISQSVRQATEHRRDSLLERGKVRLAQNSANHQQHSEEIALGLALGPLSDKHRSVSERAQRPLSRIRPASAIEETNTIRETTKHLTRQLSASSVRVSEIQSSDQKLQRSLRDGSRASFVDTQTLRIRKMSLDNRWVQ